MKTAAHYARYSSDQQNKVLIEDQKRICQERADRKGWKVSGVYNYAAIFGSTSILRPGIQSLLNDALSGKFDVKIPTTCRRVARPNPEADWIRTEVAELRIVEDVLWRAVRSRQAELDQKYEATKFGVHAAQARALHGLRRPASLFSGLMGR